MTYRAVLASLSLATAVVAPACTVDDPRTQDEPLTEIPDDPCECFGPAPAFAFNCESAPPCGQYVTYTDGTGPCATSDTSPECTSLADGNAEVLACVRAAVGDEEPFRFTHQHDPTTIAPVAIQYRQSDGFVFVENETQDDFCLDRRVSVHEAPDLSACDDWACMLTALQDAPEQSECGTYSNDCVM